MKKLKISIITPCFNEEENVEKCAAEVKKIMSRELFKFDYEHIFSDNASDDSTTEKLRALAEKDSKIKVIVNSRNVGPFRNIWNALKHSTGDAVIPMLPADLQDPPKAIPKMVELWDQGYLVVYGVRKKREEVMLMRFMRSSYYRLVRKLAAVDIPLNSGEFMLIDKKIVRSILSTNDYYPYIRGLVAQAQVKSASVEYQWAARKAGNSKNNFVNLVDQGLNGIVSTSRIPARITLLLGFMVSFAGIAFGGYSVAAKLLGHTLVTQGITAAISGIFILGGIQLFFLGLIGEYILSIHGQVRRSPEMFEVETMNFENDKVNNKQIHKTAIKNQKTS